MDAILAQVEPSLLRTHSLNAIQQELKATTAALAHAVAASARLRDVFDASNKLSIAWTPAESGALSTQLVEALRLLAALDQSIRRIHAPLATSRMVIKAERQPSATAARPETHAIHLSIGSDSDNDNDSNRQTPSEPACRVRSVQSSSDTEDEEGPSKVSSRPARSKKRKLDASAGDASTTKPSVNDAAMERKELLALCSRRTEDLLTRRGIDRRAGLKALVAQFNQFHKHLGAGSSKLEAEASDVLSKAVSTAVSVMTKEGMEFTRHWVRQFQSAVGDVRATFDAFACQTEPSMKALAKYVDNFPLTVKEGKSLRGSLRRTLAAVKSWREGKYTASDCAVTMKAVQHALDSKCPDWDPWEDKTVCELADVLLARMAAVSGKKHAKRMRTVRGWLQKLQSALGSGL